MKKLVFLAAAAAAAATAISFSLSSTVQADPAAAEASNARMALMSRAQISTDRLPAFLSSETEVGELIVPTTTRHLGSNGKGKYFAGNNKKGETCLIIVLGDTEADFVAGAACAPTSEFAKKGVSLQVIGPDRASEGHLLPDGVDASQLGDGYTVLSPNLVLSDPNAEQKADRSVPGKGGNVVLSDLSPTRD